MHKWLFTCLLLWAMAAAPLQAQGERAGAFDYYVMALSWSPNWCALEGDARADAQCTGGQGLTWVLHGLWPQYETGWPSYCRTAQGDPTRGQTAAMVDIMGGAGAAFHQWKKHGRCSGLPAQDYFQLARTAYTRITLPAVFTQITRDLTLPAKVIEAAFLEANPGLRANHITITCNAGHIQEARICLDKSLNPRQCGADVIRDCTLTDAVLGAVR